MGLESRVKWHKIWQIMIKESLVLGFLEEAVGSGKNLESSDSILMKPSFIVFHRILSNGSIIL